MKISVTSEKPAAIKSGCVILGVFERRKLSPAAAQFDKATNGLVKKVLADGEMGGSIGQTVLVHYPSGAKCERVLLVGCGKAADLNARAYQQAVEHAAKAVNGCGADDAASYLAELDVIERTVYQNVRTLIEVTRSVAYPPDELKSKKD